MPARPERPAPAGSVLLRTVLPVLLALAAAGVFARLGLWQLDRLRERRAQNEVVGERLEAPPGRIAEMLGDTAFTRWRRARATGRFDFGAELIVGGRSRQGSPGVHILTPLRLAPDSVVLVNRGWVYAPDGATADLARWREPDSATVSGYVEPLPARAANARSRGGDAASRTIWSVDLESVAPKLPYPVLPIVLVREDTTSAAARPAAQRDAGIDTSRPAPLPPPALGEGSHRSYAIQWFAFAAIALVGAGIFVRMEMTRRGNPGLAGDVPLR